jgi:hypothetical protein
MAETTPTPVTPNIFGWAYVDVLRTNLRNAPNGNIVTPLHAGDRLDILGRTEDRRWIMVQYRADMDKAPITGWVRVSAVDTLADVDELPIVDASAQPPGTIIPAGEAVATATVTANKLNLRLGPGMDQIIIGQLTAGQTVDVIGRSDNSEWLQVKSDNGQVGWAAASWMTLSIPVENLPIVGKATTAVPRPSKTASALQGHIVFMESPGGPIYLMNADGSGLHQVSTGLDPTFNADGSKIALTRWTNPRGIWVLNVADGSQRQVLGAEQIRSPSWSPDGNAIVYEHPTMAWECRDTPLGCYTDQEIYDFFGGNECKDFGIWGYYCISDFPPKGIHFQYGLREINLTNEQIDDLPVPPFAYAPRYHPHKPEVMVLLPDGIGVVAKDANASPGKLIQGGALGAPVYSPDGRYIYVSKKSGDHWDIWRYNEDGSNPVALTRPPGLRDRAIHNVAPAVSPDGQHVIFLTNREGDGSKWKLWIMNNDGSNQHPLAPQALANIHFQFSFGRERILDWR